MTLTPAERRARLAAVPGPTGREYVVALAGRVGAWFGSPAAGASVALRYVPDRMVVEPAAFAAYLEALGGHAWPALEHCAAAIVDDFNNELVPRWVQVILSAPDDGAVHEVMVEDRQPRWDNRELLGRLRRY